MDLAAEKVKRDARIKAKEDRIKVDSGVTNDASGSAVETDPVVEEKKEKITKAKKVEKKAE